MIIKIWGRIDKGSSNKESRKRQYHEIIRDSLEPLLIIRTGWLEWDGESVCCVSMSEENSNVGRTLGGLRTDKEASEETPWGMGLERRQNEECHPCWVPIQDSDEEKRQKEESIRVDRGP